MSNGSGMSLTMWLLGAIFTIAMAVVGFAVKASYDQQAALSDKVAAQGERIATNEARFGEILRRLDSIDRKLEDLH